MLQGLAIGQELPNGHTAPGFIEYLEDAKLGRTRLGASARRSNERTTPLPVRLGPNPNATPENQWAGSPSELLDNLHATLLDWVTAVNTRIETLAIPGEDQA
ncbi:hypothetical protein JF780_05705 [Mycobacterium intracellulare]|uniref:hypothetical protein n=1 Tax=Mycobacterium intracellulare TaxID=1767 RepID=UPI001CDA0379|nr:hypothetical protein [Mycobacterium intracellulare]MCA2275486.1 hypothetical protein [Mycobacterium intracellulare]MCA2324446.1 hypothetical protein [Mycobacterium intracellulare]